MTNLDDRFWSKVQRSNDVDCWIWTGSTDSGGYGTFHIPKIGREKRRQLGAHRLAYEDTHGPIPQGLVIDHLCRVRHCVNPAHVEPVTDGENTRRGDAPEACRNKDTCRSGKHPWPESARLMADGFRTCRECEREKIPFRPSLQPADCDVCGKTLSTSYSLKLHKRRRHAILLAGASDRGGATDE